MRGKIKQEIEKNKQHHEMKISLKNKIVNRIFENGVMVIFIVVYLYLLKIGSVKIPQEMFLLDLKVFGTILLVTSIHLLEKAYRRDRTEIFIQGIEFALLSFVTLFTGYLCYDAQNIILLNYIIILGILIYFVLKVLIIYMLGKKEHKDGLSDVKEILEDKTVEKEIEEVNTEFVQNEQSQSQSTQVSSEEKDEQPKKSAGTKNAPKKKTTTKKSAATTAKKTTAKKTTKTTTKKKSKEGEDKQ